MFLLNLINEKVKRITEIIAIYVKRTKINRKGRIEVFQTVQKMLQKAQSEYVKKAKGGFSILIKS